MTDNSLKLLSWQLDERHNRYVGFRGQIASFTIAFVGADHKHVDGDYLLTSLLPGFKVGTKHFRSRTPAQEYAETMLRSWLVRAELKTHV